MSSAGQQFGFNVAFTVPVNCASETPVLTADDLWQGIKHGARYPHEMAPYLANCEELPGGSELEFRRTLTMANGGAVHTVGGGTIDQDVVLRPMLSVRYVCVNYTPGHSVALDGPRQPGARNKLINKVTTHRLRRPPLPPEPKPPSPCRWEPRVRRTCT